MLIIKKSIRNFEADRVRTRLAFRLFPGPSMPKCVIPGCLSSQIQHHMQDNTPRVCEGRGGDQLVGIKRITLHITSHHIAFQKTAEDQAICNC